MSSSPTQRTLAHYRNLGWTCQVVEKWNQYAKVRQDLFGFIDIVALPPEPYTGVTGIQATSGSNHTSRVEKILNEPRALRWCASGGMIAVVSWRKLRKKNSDGKRSKVSEWVPRVEWIDKERFPAPPL